MRWIVDRVVPRIPWIVKDAALERPWSRVSRNDVQVDVAVLILEKCVVEVVRMKCEGEGNGGFCQAPVQFQPFVFSEVGRLFHMPAGGQEALAQQILVAIENKPPMSAFNDDWTEGCVAKGTCHEFLHYFNIRGTRVIGRLDWIRGASGHWWSHAVAVFAVDHGRTYADQWE